MLTKESNEYRSNGHYQVNGEDWMSVWTYKKKNGLDFKDYAKNSSDGLYMTSRYESIVSKPDFGNFDEINIFKVSDLAAYLNS